MISMKRALTHETSTYSGLLLRLSGRRGKAPGKQNGGKTTSCPRWPSTSTRRRSRGRSKTNAAREPANLIRIARKVRPAARRGEYRRIGGVRARFGDVRRFRPRVRLRVRPRGVVVRCRRRSGPRRRSRPAFPVDRREEPRSRACRRRGSPRGSRPLLPSSATTTTKAAAAGRVTAPRARCGTARPARCRSCRSRPPLRRPTSGHHIHSGKWRYVAMESGPILEGRRRRTS